MLLLVTDLERPGGLPCKRPVPEWSGIASKQARGKIFAQINVFVKVIKFVLWKTMVGLKNEWIKDRHSSFVAWFSCSYCHTRGISVFDMTIVKSYGLVWPRFVSFCHDKPVLWCVLPLPPAPMDRDLAQFLCESCQCAVDSEGSTYIMNCSRFTPFNSIIMEL